MALKPSQINLLSGQREGLQEMKHRLQASFPVQEVIVFGSVARGTAGEDSDIDVLVITAAPLSHKERRKMSSITFDIDLKYGTCISLVVVDAAAWYNGIYQYTALYNEVQKDGVTI